MTATNGMKRRDALKTMGGLAGAAALGRLAPGCGAAGPEPGTTHVFLMMENRSFDHFLGARALEGLGGDGLTRSMSNPDASGALIAPWEATVDTMCVPDPPHSWGSSRQQWNGGACDGFVRAQQVGVPGDTGPMQYLTRAHLPVTWALADEYAVCDRWFASVMGATWPNRMYWLSGTSMGMQNNDLPPGGWTAPLIYDQLDAAGVEWKLYIADLPWVALLGFSPPQGRVRNIEEFFADAAAGTLPPVVFLDPPFSYADDHPPHHPVFGQQYLASVYNALAASPQWEKSMLVVTYDEHGGFFDHVSPPTVVDDRAAEGFDQLGFRVPTLVVGPYVKRSHVSSVVRDHTSALRHLQVLHGLGDMGMRTAAANDLSELLDEARVASGDAAPPIVLPAVEVESWMVEAVCQKSDRSYHDILRIADEHPEWMARWDLRDRLPQTMKAIAARARSR
jgi:phospholipase C